MKKKYSVYVKCEQTRKKKNVIFNFTIRLLDNTKFFNHIDVINWMSDLGLHEMNFDKPFVGINYLCFDTNTDYDFSLFYINDSLTIACSATCKNAKAAQRLRKLLDHIAEMD
jgi:hypothetical protein